jgi:DNA polymerase-1
MYRVEMPIEEAETYREAFYARFPRVRQWQRETADTARALGELRSVIGRPLRAEWEGGELSWPTCCNFPVQSSTADAMMIAMARVDRALAGHDARLILQVHDELVAECAEAEAEAVEAILIEEMTAAWRWLWPEAPTDSLVDVDVRRCWAKPPKKKKEATNA